MCMTSIDQVDSDNLEFIINHVFLPPKLPDKADENSQEKDSALLGFIKDSAEAYQKQLEGPYPKWESCIKMLSSMAELQSSYSLPKAILIDAIGKMCAGGNNSLHSVIRACFKLWPLW